MKKTIVVTGALGNLGRATVERFVREGYTVVVSAAPGENTDLYKGNPSIIIYTVDLLNESGAENFITTVIQKHGGIHAALLLVGGYASGNIKDTTGEALKKMYALNFESAYFVARPVFNHMISQKSGKIILVGARPALVAADGKNSLAYALSKSLIFKLADFLNAEGSPYNVTATVIVPSIIDTPANRKSMPDADFTAWVKADEIAEAMSFIIAETNLSLRETVLKMYGRA
jgi:NAD(P)-dependent dehydrogenase (short-subunit alcohol dehydrogenase family)